MASSMRALERARALVAPAVEATTGGETEGMEFWNEQETLVQEAWQEWYQDQTDLPELSQAILMNPDLYRQVHDLWLDPTEEKERNLLQKSWEELVPGVFVCRNFFTVSGIRRIRDHMDAAQQAVKSPWRRPNGMNRHGMVLDMDTPGAVTSPPLLDWIQWLADTYIRPLGRTCFPEFAGRGEPPDDSQVYAFTIHYQGEQDAAGQASSETKKKGDKKLPEHSDASLFTLNVNLNLPEEREYEGSLLEFRDQDADTSQSIRLEPGMAVLHRGLHKHQAHPIQSGQRHQLVVWLFGDDGYVRFMPYEDDAERRSVQERWMIPSGKKSMDRERMTWETEESEDIFTDSEL
eukprot:CAMPEP_0176054556 /NCGR_PEP_ID=MMETSP0120_2-20121206/27145_1 /TAXON_ID=160619 /ORGANISM="Kryptoperidinium foliaceum, Strain CCMP 1326" /LENGTH=347 /DNA_ID=CAMNT_0017388023 /DNA_START=135 /DNA_END=1177 /DNA_ORIENTATION=+